MKKLFIKNELKFLKKDVEKYEKQNNRNYVRVSENEKKKLQKNAQKANLKLSSYLRKVGLKKKIYEIQDEELRKIYAGIVELKNEFPYMSNEEIKEKIAKMQSDFLDIYNHKKDGDDNGNNENMGN